MNPPTVLFRKVEKKIKLLKLFLYLFEINNIFLRFCLCIFESDTVKTDCPVQIFRRLIKYLKI